MVELLLHVGVREVADLPARLLDDLHHLLHAQHLVLELDANVEDRAVDHRQTALVTAQRFHELADGGIGALVHDVEGTVVIRGRDPGAERRVHGVLGRLVDDRGGRPLARVGRGLLRQRAGLDGREDVLRHPGQEPLEPLSDPLEDAGRLALDRAAVGRPVAEGLGDGLLDDVVVRQIARSAAVVALGVVVVGLAAPAGSVDVARQSVPGLGSGPEQAGLAQDVYQLVIDKAAQGLDDLGDSHVRRQVGRGQLDQPPAFRRDAEAGGRGLAVRRRDVPDQLEPRAQQRQLALLGEILEALDDLIHAPGERLRRRRLRVGELQRIQPVALARILLGIAPAAIARHGRLPQEVALGIVAVLQHGVAGLAGRLHADLGGLGPGPGLVAPDLGDLGPSLGRAHESAQRLAVLADPDPLQGQLPHHVRARRALGQVPGGRLALGAQDVREAVVTLAAADDLAAVDHPLAQRLQRVLALESGRLLDGSRRVAPVEADGVDRGTVLALGELGPRRHGHGDLLGVLRQLVQLAEHGLELGLAHIVQIPGAGRAVGECLEVLVAGRDIFRARHLLDVVGLDVPRRGHRPAQVDQLVDPRLGHLGVGDVPEGEGLQHRLATRHAPVVDPAGQLRAQLF